MREDPLVSVIILNYNGKNLLPACIDSVIAQSYGNLEIILVDNHSSDGSIEFVRVNYPRVKIIVNDRNLGYAPAANIGIEGSAGEFLVVLNNDTRVDPQWIGHLVRVAVEDGRIGSCASKQLNYSNPKMIDSTGIQLFRGGYAKDRGRNEEDHGQYDTLAEVFGAPGASAFYLRAALDQVGLFDSDYFAYCEEFDLSCRIRLAGWKCVYVPDAVIYHMSGKTRAHQDEEFRLYYMERNRILTIVKNYPVSLLLLYLPFLLKYELDIWLRFFNRFETVLLAARIGALRLLPKMLIKRRLIQKNRKVPVINIRRFIVCERG